MRALAAMALVCAATASSAATPPKVEATRELIAAPDGGSRKIELYWRKPDGAGPFPLIVLLHGHQEPGPARIGGRAFVDWGVLDQLADAGIVAVAMSQPGYGGSDGPADYCGPATQAAVRAVVGRFRALPFVDGKRVALEGISRGAVVAAMVAAQDETLAGAVLISGAYDLKALYDGGMDDGSKRNLSSEVTPLSAAAFAARSALAHAQEIKVPLLILSGANDPSAPPAQAAALAEALRARGRSVELVSFANAGHQIPVRERTPIIDRFLNARLRPGKPLP